MAEVLRRSIIFVGCCLLFLMGPFVADSPAEEKKLEKVDPIDPMDHSMPVRRISCLTFNTINS